MSPTKPPPIRPDWIAKTLAGTLLGFTLAVGCSGVLVVLTPDMAKVIQGQLAMWLVMPVWLGVLGLVFLFASGWRAWLWLGAANLLVFGALAAARLS